VAKGKKHLFSRFLFCVLSCLLLEKGLADAGRSQEKTISKPHQPKALNFIYDDSGFLFSRSLLQKITILMS